MKDRKEGARKQERRLSIKAFSGLLPSAFCLLTSVFCLLSPAFAGTHVNGVYSVGASPAVMATVNGNSEYGLVFAQRNKSITYNNILYVNNVVTAYFDVNGNLNDGGGNQWIDLIPDANSTPGDSYYVVTINIQGAVHSEIWIVPDQASVNVLSVRQTAAPPPGGTSAPVFFYQTVQQSGANLAQRPTLNLTGAGVSCLDNSGLQRTDCTITGGSGGGGSGTVTSFSAGALSPLFTTSVATSTTTPALTFLLSSAGAHAFLGNNTGGSAVPAFVQPSASDIAGLAASATTDTTNAANISSGTLAAARLPNPTAGALGGVKSFNAVASVWLTGISLQGTPTSAQPACGDLSNAAASCSTDATNAANISSGTLAAARLPNPSATALGGVESLASVSHKWINAISTSGVPTATQPLCSDLSDASGGCTMSTTAGGDLSGTLPSPVVAKVNGTSVPTNAAADQTIVTTASATGAWKAINNCGDSTHALSYSTGTHAFGCQAITASAAAGGSSGQVQWNNSTALGGITNLTTTGTVTTALTGADWLFADPTDSTKKAQFDLSGITTATTRTITVPNANSTLLQPSTCTNQAFTAFSASGAGTCTTITSAYTSGTFTATAHNLLSTTHGDTTASSAVRGGAIFAVGASPTWTQVAHSSATGGYWKWNGTDVVASTGAASGTGTPTDCSNQVVTGFTLASDTAPTSTCTSLTGAFLPNPSASTLGGVESLASVSHKWINTISTSGVPSATQPADTDISGTTAGAIPYVSSSALAELGTTAYSVMVSGTTNPAWTTPTANGQCFMSGASSFATTTPSFQSCPGGGMSNPMTTLGDIIYENATPAAARLAGQTTTTKEYLSQTGNGSISAAPAWAQVAYADLSGTPTLPVTIAQVSHKWLDSYTSTTGAFTQSQPVLGDINGGTAGAVAFDFTSATSLKVPGSGGATTSAAGQIVEDTTRKDYHNFTNAVDSKIATWTTDPTAGNCVKWVAAGSTFQLADQGGACGGSGSPGGSNTQIQYNSSSSFAGASNFTYTVASGLITANQFADTNDTIYGIRATDTTPTGYFLRFQNHAAASDLFKVSVSGVATASEYDASGSGDFKLTATGTNNNVVLVPNGTGKAQVADGTDTTKLLSFDMSAQTTAITGKIATSFTTAKTWTIPDATDTAVGKATTDTLTNKSIDAEGTGNVITQPSKVWFVAASCNNATAAPGFDLPTSNAATPTCQGTNIRTASLDYADSAVQKAYFNFKLPSDWTGNIDAKIKWFTTATTNATKWQIATGCLTDGTTDATAGPTLNAVQTVTDNDAGTAKSAVESSITSLTTTGCAAGRIMYFELSRDNTDTNTATASVLGVDLTIRRAM